MKSGFSEKNYETAYICEYLKHSAPNSILIPPFQPSSAEEAELGYDVRFDDRVVGRSLFLQFKVSQYLSNTGRGQLSHFEGPYYRMKLHKSNVYAQHNLLLKLSARVGGVYYCAPMFHHWSEFVDRVRNQRLVFDSVYVNPETIGQLTDRSQHYMNYDLEGGNHIFTSSEPKSGSISSIVDVVEETKMVKIDQDYIRNLTSTMEHSVDEIWGKKVFPKYFAGLGPVERIAFMLGKFFRVAWLVIDETMYKRIIEDKTVQSQKHKRLR